MIVVHGAAQMKLAQPLELEADDVGRGRPYLALSACWSLSKVDAVMQP